MKRILRLDLRDWIGLLSLAVAVAAAALTWAVGARSRAQLDALANSVNPRLLVISLAREMSEDAGERMQAMDSQVTLLPSEIQRLRQVPGVDQLAVRGSQFFVTGQRYRLVQQVASANLPAVLGLRLEAGRSVTPEEEQLGLPLTVIGKVAAQEYFPDGKALGNPIKTGFGTFRVVGVLSELPPDLQELKFLDAALLVPASADPAGSRQRTMFSQQLFVAYASGQEARVRNALEQILADLPVAGMYEVRSGAEWLGAPQVFRQQVAQGLSSATDWTVWLALLAAGANLMNLFTLRVLDRQRELAVRRAVGATRRQLLVEVSADQLSLGVLGALVGVAGAWAVSRALPGLLVQPSPEVMAWALVAGVLLCLIAGLWPNWQAVRLPVAATLGRRGPTPTWEGVGLSGLILGVATLLASFAVSSGSERWVSTLIRERGGQRVVFTTLTGPFDQIRTILPKPPVGLEDYRTLNDPAIARKALVGLNTSIWTLPGVTGSGGKVTLAHPLGEYWAFAARPLVAGQRASAPHEAVVGADLLTSVFAGVRPDQVIGRSLPLVNAQGQTRTLRVVGVFQGGSWSFFGDLDGRVILTPHTPQDPPISALPRDLHLEVREDVDFTLAVRRLEALLTARHPDGFAPATATYPAGDLQPVRTTLQAAAAGYRRTAFIMIVIGTLGLMNLLLVRVSRRQGEIGVRRAVGATRVQIVTQFIGESLTLSALGCGAGIILGATFIAVIAQRSPWTPALDWWMLPSVLALAGSIAIVAGSLPSFLAAGLSPVTALRSRA